jgi:hypothetical protein
MSNEQHPLDDSIRGALGATADDIDVDLFPANAIERRGRTRRRRRRFLGGGAVAVLTVGTVAIATRGGDDSIQTADDPTPPTSLVEIATIDDDATGQGDGATVITTPPTLPSADDAADDAAAAIPDVGSEMAADSAAYYGVDPGSLVPWGDGFLSVRMEYSDQPLAALPDEVAALFPDEVMALFPDGLPSTINEATEILNEAGLYDVVSEIVLEHPEAFDAIYAAPTPPPTPIVEFTIDGQEWSEVGTALPEMAYGQIAAGNGVIVVWSLDQAEYDDTGFPIPVDNRTLTVARSTDLSSWDISTTEIPVAVDDRPYVRSELWVQHVAPTPTGWVATVQSSSWIDDYRILPDDVRARLVSERRDWGINWTSDGVDIDVWNVDDDESTTIESYTWAELGIDPLTEFELYGGNEQFELIVHDGTGTRFADPPPNDDGYLNQIISGADGRLVAVTGNGVFTSTDAIAWTPVDGLPGSAWIDGAVPVDGGVLLLSSSTPAPRGWLLADGGGLTEVGLPELPSAYGLWGPGTSAAWIVEAYDDSMVMPVIDPVIFTVERDGIAVMISVGPNLTVTAVDTATGEVVFEADVELGEVETSDFFDEETGDLVVRDADGAEIVRFSNDELEAAYESAAPEPEYTDEEYAVDEGSYYEPDLWLLATPNGVDWLTIDLADPDMTSSYSWPPAAAINGNRVLYHDGTDWQVATVGG